TSPANAGEEKRGLAKRRKQSDGEYFNEERFGAPSATRNASNPDEGESHGRTTIQRHPSDRAGGTRRRGKDQPCRSDAVRSRRHRPPGVDGQRLQHRRFEPRSAPAPLAAPALRALDELGIPHLIFVNRIDQAHGRIRDLLSALQPMSVSPLI